MAVADEFSRPSATAPAYDRQPPQDVPAEQSVLGGMLLSKDAIADVVEVAARRRLLPARAPDHLRLVLDLYGRGEPADAITVAAELNRTDQLSKMGGAVYLHTLIAVDAHGGQRRLLRRDRGRAGRAAAAGRGRHPRGAAGLRRGRRQGRRRRHRRPRPAGDLRRHREAHERGLLAPRGRPAADDGRAGRHRLPRRREPRRPDRHPRPRRADQRPAVRPDDRHRGPSWRGQIDPRTGHCAVGVGEAPHARRHLLARDEQARDHHASAVGRGEGAAAPHARRHAVATRTGRSWPAGWARSPMRRSTSTTPRT